MLNNFNISVNISAASVSKTASGTYDLNARFGGSIPTDGNWTTSKSIDSKIYAENKAAARKDYEKFDGEVESLAEKLSPIINELMERLAEELKQEMAQN